MKIETIENVLKFLEAKEGKKITDRMFHYIEKLKLIKELENHPDGTQYRHEGDLHLINSNITKLPNDLYVTGNCYLENSHQLKVLPIKLHVGGSLDLANCVYITELPDNLYVGNNLSLFRTKISNFPNNLYVETNIYLYNTPLANKYTTYNQMLKIFKSTGGKINGKIFT
jgi:hypothetical protein